MRLANNCITRGFVTCTPLQILPGWTNKWWDRWKRNIHRVRVKVSQVEICALWDNMQHGVVILYWRCLISQKSTISSTSQRKREITDCLNLSHCWLRRHTSIGEWRYSCMHSYSWQQVQVSSQLHFPAALTVGQMKRKIGLHGTARRKQTAWNTYT
jgi:hypothetical protein